MSTIDWQAVHAKLPSEVGTDGRQARQVRQRRPKMSSLPMVTQNNFVPGPVEEDRCERERDRLALRNANGTQFRNTKTSFKAMTTFENIVFCLQGIGTVLSLERLDIRPAVSKAYQHAKYVGKVQKIVFK